MTGYYPPSSSGATAGALVYQGVLDCSTNPNYPAAVNGDTYIITVAGKVGGASGKTVEVGDMVIAKADNAGGAEASVGTSWIVVQGNVAFSSVGLAVATAADAAAARTALNVDQAVPTGTRITGYWSAAPTGYVLANGAFIGKSGSAASIADDATEQLFLLLWDAYSSWGNWGTGNTDGRLWFDGADATPTTAASDWANGRIIKLPNEHNRVAIMQNGGTAFGGQSGSQIGRFGGEENHTLTEGEIPAHSHVIGGRITGVDQDGGGNTRSVVETLLPDNSGDFLTEVGQWGGGEAHNNVQPFVCVNVAIKL